MIATIICQVSRLSRNNETATLAWNHRDEEFDYDGLHRVVEGRRGVRDGSFTHSATKPSQKWDLDILGNWDELKTWSSGSYVSAETRTHNDVNEMVERVIGSNSHRSVYDKAGNIREQEVPVGGSAVTIIYTHDAWNRLVKIEYGSSIRSEYRYNGLNWRVVKRADTSMPPDGDLNQQRVMYYSANWQLLEERIDDDWSEQSSSDDRKMQYFWGNRYIDDIVARREVSLGAPGMSTWYHLTDAQFSTVAIINDFDAMIVERISYDAYGKARHHTAGDLNGNGATGVPDLNLSLRPVWQSESRLLVHRDPNGDAARAWAG